MAVKLEKIQGIGKRLRDKILDHFQDENSAIKALRNGMGSVIPGISQKQSIKIARSIFEAEYNAKIDDVLKNEHAIEIYNDLINYISQYFITDYSKNKISLFFPLKPEPYNLKLIQKRYEIFQKAIQFTNSYKSYLEEHNLLEHLEKLSILKNDKMFKKINSRVIVTDNQDVFEFLELELNDLVETELYNLDKISDPVKYFESLASSFETVIIITENLKTIPDLANIFLLNKDEITTETLIPEKIISYFSSYSTIIDSVHEIANILLSIDQKSLIADFTQIINFERMNDLKENTQILTNEGEIVQGYDPKLDYYLEDVEKFPGYIIEIENQINENIKQDINSSEITIEGEKILDLFRLDATIENFREFIPTEVDDLINDSIESGITNLQDQFHLTKKDFNYLNEIHPDIVEIPVTLNPLGLDQFEKFIKKRAAVYKYEKLREIASSLKENQDYLNEMIWNILEFDFFYGVGRFSYDFKLEIPEIVTSSNGITLENAHNLYLMENTIKNGIPTIPIDYSIGDIPFSTQIPCDKKSRLNLLSGSNSGGKTMCILTIAHAMILAQMGFPTSGKVKINPFSEIYYFKKSSGQISAGAFENTLLMFVDLAQSSEKKLILADELEAITEPNAAAKVISSLFSLILENPNNYAVFVTHLIDMLLENLSDNDKNTIRVDGIEARGLDDNLNLIVNRSPIFNFIAKSTPELIIERLSKTGKTNQKEFFNRILESFTKKLNPSINN